MNTQIVHVGADVAEAHIDLYGPIKGLPEQIANTRQGIASLLKMLKRNPGVRLTCEATGGCERLLVRACLKAGVAVSPVNPQRVRDFARAKGQLAKTDKIDARILAEYGAAMQPALREPLDRALEKLAAFSTRRRQLLESRAAENNRLRRADPLIASSHRAVIRTLNTQIAAVDRALAAIGASCSKLRAKIAALTQVKGVGSISAIALLAALPELGSLSKNQAASLAGLAPFNRDSGKFRGQRHIHGGRTSARIALYMAALVAARHNPVISSFYSRLRSNGKPPKVALIASMRKLLIHLNSLLKNLIPIPI
jgi:transposase